MAEEKKDGCTYTRCPDHTHTLERVAMLEKGSDFIERAMSENITRIEAISNMASQEFKIIREEIANGILKRYPAGIVIVVSILSSACAALLTALFTNS